MFRDRFGAFDSKWMQGTTGLVEEDVVVEDALEVAAVGRVRANNPGGGGRLACRCHLGVRWEGGGAAVAVVGRWRRCRCCGWLLRRDVVVDVVRRAGMDEYDREEA